MGDAGKGIEANVVLVGMTLEGTKDFGTQFCDVRKAFFKAVDGERCILDELADIGIGRFVIFAPLAHFG